MFNDECFNKKRVTYSYLNIFKAFYQKMDIQFLNSNFQRLYWLLLGSKNI